ncbi:MAG: zf-HC2 domain-containing protein [Oscillospiraceae bacterium]|nr:zf-HC2 domain-containing protein [Oscillospiraceae bacterium]
MKQNTNNCEMVQDLIPLYSEGLCSDVSRKIVEEHTAVCKTCRQLLTQIPTDAVPDVPVPDESKAFRKVHKKMKKSRLRNVILSALLAAVVIPVGVLTVGQIVKTPEIQSFETVWQSIEVKQLVKKLAKGDIEGYMAESSWSNALKINNVHFTMQDYEIIRMQDTENLKKAYENAFAENEVDRISVRSNYTGMYNDSACVVYTIAELYFENGSQIEVHFTKESDGLYSGYYMSSANTEERNDFQHAFNYVNQHELLPDGWFEELLMTGESGLTDEKIEYMMPGILERFEESHHEQIETSLKAFYQRGYQISQCSLSKLCYDKERNMLFYDIFVTAKDTQGTAILHTRLYSTYEGLIPPEEDMITIHTNGCTDALAADLAKLFG